VIDRVCLWEFPEHDFAEWSRLVVPPAVDTYLGYLALLTAVQADAERQGFQVVRVRLSVTPATCCKRPTRRPSPITGA